MFEKNKTAVIDSLLPREAFHPFPGFRERDSWNALPVELADFLIRKGKGISDMTGRFRWLRCIWSFAATATVPTMNS